MEKIRNTLHANERLKSRKLIGEIFKSGKSFSHFPFRVIYLCAPKCISPLQTAFSVSSKTFRKAVDRNRIKRLMRESYRLQKQDLQDYIRDKNICLIVFVIYKGTDLPDFDIVKEKMNGLLNRLKNVC